MRNFFHHSLSFFVVLFTSIGFQPANAVDKPPSLLDQLGTLVQIPSETGNTEGILEVQHWIETQLKPLGFQIELGDDHLLVATLEGRKPKTITLLMHADTVHPSTSDSAKLELSEDKKKASGAGVTDDKGGIVVAIEGLRRYLKSSAPKFNIRVVSSPSEEKGSPNLANRFSALATDSWMVLGFEPALQNGSLIQSRRGNRWYSIHAQGKEAHSGRAHKEGVNACNALAIAVAEMSKLTRYDRDVTVSIGSLEGGQDKFNIVCGEAQAKVDTRFSSLSEREQLHRRILKILSLSPVKGAKLSFKLEDDSLPFSGTKNALPLLKQYQAAVQQLEGKGIALEKSGGAADSNFFSHENAIILDGLGPTGDGAHTSGEFIWVSSLETRAEALHRFLAGIK